MRTGAIFFCALLFVVAGCAEVPRPATFPYSFQKQLQSASHWDLIAKSTIEDLCTTLVGGPDQPLYVQSSDKSPFGRAFRTYLITELIKSGFKISSSPDKSISINWSVQLIRRNVERRKPALPGLHNAIATAGWTAGWTARAFGHNAPLATYAVASELVALLMDHELNQTTTDLMVPHTELILTTTVTGTQGILAATKTYYINDQDRNNYWASSDISINLPGAFTSDVSKPVTFTVVNR